MGFAPSQIAGDQRGVLRQIEQAYVVASRRPDRIRPLATPRPMIRWSA